jgi:hypothetical protein
MKVMKHYAHAPLFLLLATRFTFADHFPRSIFPRLSERATDPCDQECRQLAADALECNNVPDPVCSCADYTASGSECVQCTKANPTSTYAGPHIEVVEYLCLCHEWCPGATQAFNVCNDFNPDMSSDCVCRGVVDDAGGCYNCLLKQSTYVADIFNYTYFDCVNLG